RHRRPPTPTFFPYTTLFRSSYTDDQAMRAQLSGRANMRTQALGWLSPLAKHEESKVKSTVRYALMPGGPAGQFPGSNSHGNNQRSEEHTSELQSRGHLVCRL